MNTNRPGLGRMRTTDLRNHAYRMAAATNIEPPVRKMWRPGPVLDQGETSQCVAYAATALLQCGPVVNTGVYPWDTPENLYHRAQLADEWEGTDYEGTSALGAMKVLKLTSYVGEYSWAYDVHTLVAWLLLHGPVMLGTDWYETMFDTEKYKGGQWLRLHAEKAPQIVGGHETCLIGADQDKPCPDGTKGAVRLQNSWNASFGDGGRCWLAFSELDVLMRQGGDAVTPTELKFKTLASVEEFPA